MVPNLKPIRVVHRVAEEDEAMKIGPWVARKRKAFWEPLRPDSRSQLRTVMPA